MHEIVFANRVVEEAKKEVKNAGHSVNRITVEVGELAPIPASELEEALRKVVDWGITIIEKKAVVKCYCGFRGRPRILERGHDYAVFQCPRCGDVPRVLDGCDIILKEVR